MVAPANVVQKAKGLTCSLMYAMKLHYVANIIYPDSVKSLDGVLVAFFQNSLGTLAKRVIAENK